MSIKYNSIIPSGGSGGSDPTKLPLTGGTMTGTIYSIADDISKSFSADIFENDERIVRIAQAFIGSDGTYGFIKLQGEASTSIGFYAYSDGSFIKFGDGSQQTTAGLPLTGGTVTGTIIVQEPNYPTNGYVQINAGTYPQLKVYNGDGVGMEVGDGININTPIFLSGGASIQFPDSSIQTTAGLPFTGGTLTGDLILDGVIGAGLSVNNYAEITTNIAEGIEIIQQNLTAPEAQVLNIYPQSLQFLHVDPSDDTTTFTVSASGIQKTGAAGFSLLGDYGLTMDVGISFTPTTGLTLKADSNSKITFPDLSEQTTAYAPTVENSGLSQSGNIAHSDYPKEIQLVINGVTFAIPARQL